MKPILLIHTGGTIGTAQTAKARTLTNESISSAKLFLVEQYQASDSPFAAYAARLTLAPYPDTQTTLSENMTPGALSHLISFLREVDPSLYDGIVVLHGTDTLAYTAAFLSFLFADLPIPLLLVSGNRPPANPQSNATANFRAAVDLIWQGLPPHVYVTYRNQDGVMRLYLGATLLQSPNFTEDFFGADPKKVFVLTNQNALPLAACHALSQSRTPLPLLSTAGCLSAKVLLIHPYTGLDYTLYTNTLDGYIGVVHGSYHSGTVCFPPKACPHSVGQLAAACREKGIPFVVAPSHLGKEQYETMSRLVKETSATLLPMTTEAAYAKLTLLSALPLSCAERLALMQQDICGEMML